jgi:hypothetical protein
MKTLKHCCLSAPIAGLLASLCAATLAFAGMPAAKIAVLSDLHYCDPKLAQPGPALTEYQWGDPNMVVESEAILNAAIENAVSMGAKIILIPGDLTKDGEVHNHVRVAQRLSKLEKHGVKVYVVPGNHDIFNSHAAKFNGEYTRPLPTASPQVFESLYKQFGYKEAIWRDKHSLSYLAEPVKGLWLIGIDSCRYEESRVAGEPVVGGTIKPETMDWILSIMAEARARGKQVIAFMHHGLNPNFPVQPMLFGDYLVDDYADVAHTLANAGLRVVFTGHYHTIDTAWSFVPKNALPSMMIWDVETPSLAAYPSAFRMVDLADGVLNITTHRITEIDADTDGMAFQDYAEKFIMDRLPTLVRYRLVTEFHLSPDQAAFVEPWMTEALMANYDGDEHIPQDAVYFIQWLRDHEQGLLADMLAGLWYDFQPGDNQVTIDLIGDLDN